MSKTSHSPSTDWENPSRRLDAQNLVKRCRELSESDAVLAADTWLRIYARKGRSEGWEDVTRILVAMLIAAVVVYALKAI